MRTFLAFWSFLLLSGFLGVAVAEEDDPFGTDSIFFFNVMSAAESEFYCKNKKLSAELRSASAEMMQAEVRARGDEGSTLQYSADVFVLKKRNQLELLETFSRDPSARKPPTCDEVKIKAMRRQLETKKKVVELLKIARDNAIKSQNDCPHSADYYREKHLRSSRIDDLACFKKAAARELR